MKEAARFCGQMAVVAIFLLSIPGSLAQAGAVEPETKMQAIQVEEDFLKEMILERVSKAGGAVEHKKKSDESSVVKSKGLSEEEILIEREMIAEKRSAGTIEALPTGVPAERKAKPLWPKPVPRAKIFDLQDELMQHGKESFTRGEFSQSRKDFEAVLALNFGNTEAQEWLAKAEQALRIDELKRKKEALIDETEIATLKKEVEERKRLLELEKAYQPPQKRKTRIPQIAPAAKRDEEPALMAKLKEKIVPAISLTEADIRDVIRQLMKLTEVTIILDERVLAKAKENEPLKVTFATVTPMPLLDILEIALKSTNLGYKIEENYIWISDEETLTKEKLETRTYKLKYGTRKIRKVELEKLATTTGGTTE